MRSERDTTRIVRSWLDEGVTALPDRVLDAVLDQLPATPQRRPGWLARRFPTMNNAIVRYGIAAAAIVIIALLGFRFLGPGANTGGPPEATPTPTPQQMPAGELAAGSYLMPETYGPQFSFIVPAGWSNADGFVSKDLTGSAPLGTDAGVMLTAWVVDHVYADACHPNEGPQEVGPTVDALATLLGQMSGRAVAGPDEAVIGGRSATRIELTSPEDVSAAGCDGGILRNWTDPNGDATGGWPARSGQVDLVYLVDVDGTRAVIVATHWANTSAADLQELDDVIGSIAFVVD